MSAFTNELTALLSSAKKAPGFIYKYGTAGFREKAPVLNSVFVRMGLLAWLRAVDTNQAVGLMVTASHNPVQDNGIKLVDPDGGMLAQSWEEHATLLANAPDENVLEVFDSIASRLAIDLNKNDFGQACVVLGMDTRPHSKSLSDLSMDGIKALNGKFLHLGVVTTPQLHHVVRHMNLGPKDLASEAGYYKKVSLSFLDLIGDRQGSSKVVIDCAYGVGGPKVELLLKQVNANRQVLQVELRNVPGVGTEDLLNNGVGAEHVQKKLLVPENTLVMPQDELVRFASFDGDADRIVYFCQEKDGRLRLLDGDKIATLFAMFIKKQLALLPADVSSGVTIGCVQTAYANGASTAFIKNTVQVPTPVAKTGVKFCHHKAVEYDVGIYFEANGHGTVLFKQSMIEMLKKVPIDSLNAEQQLALRRLLLLEQLINQATGDAMADFLAIEAILMVEDMNLDGWNGLYSDLPSRQLKCKVADRSVIITSEDETRVLEPEVLQNAIDKVVAMFECGRAFVRPSGTEDVVRIYAEAMTSSLADELAELVRKAAFDHAGGIE